MASIKQHMQMVDLLHRAAASANPNGPVPIMEVNWEQDAEVTLARLYAVAELARELAAYTELLSGLLAKEYPLQAGVVNHMVSRLESLTDDLTRETKESM